MKRFSWPLLIFFTLIAVWLSIPPLSVKIPFISKPVAIKPQNPSLTIFGRKIVLDKGFRFGLDLQGGSELRFSLDTSKLPSQDVEDAVNAARNIIERRVNFFGISESQVLLLKNGNQYSVLVDLPGQKNPQEAVDQIGKTAQLDFREYAVREVKQGTESAFVPYFIPSKLTGKFLKKAALVFDPNTGDPQISLAFNAEGTKMFAALTKKNITKPLAIYLDNNLLTAPTVQQEIKTGEAVITGKFTIDEAKELIFSLNAGALPLPIRLVEQKTIEATLGARNIRMSIIAGIIGLWSVVLFMVLLYRKEGVIAVVSLLLYAIYSITIYKTVGIVLTMSGIAGFILSIGMAVDSNILIYEKIKEERLRLKNESLAVKVGFLSALQAIKEANINTLLVCFVLLNPFNFSFLPEFGIVKGFAITLGLGVLVSLFTGVVITKNILWKVYKI